MRLLADTHTFFWWISDDDRLSARVRLALADPANDVFVSAVSVIEMTTKVRIAKWPEAEWIVREMPDLILSERFLPLPIYVDHAQWAGCHPSPHKDPFDRLLAAQASIDGLSLASNDPAFASFSIEVFW